MADRTDPDLIHYLEVLARRRLIIVTAMVAAILVSVAVALASSKVYVARTTLLPEVRSETSIPSPISGLLATIGNIGGGRYRIGGADPGDVLAGVLESRTLAVRVARACDLLEGSPVTPADSLIALDLAFRRLSRNIKTERTDNGIIELEVSGRDPVRVAEVANTLVAELDALSRELTYSSASATRQFTEGRLVSTQRALDAAQGRLVAFQDEHGAIALDEQAQAMVREMAELEGRIIALEARREAARANYAASFATVRELDAQISVLERQRVRLVGTKTNGPEPETTAPPTMEGSVLLPLREVPQLAARFANLRLQVEIQASVLTVLHQQLEQAKIEESRDVPVIQVLDPAIPPLRHTRPKRRLMVVFGAIVGLMAGVALAFTQEWLHTHTDEADRLRRVARAAIPFTRT